MTPNAKRLFPVLWCGGWGALMLASGAVQWAVQASRNDGPSPWSWLRVWAASYLVLGPLLALAAVRLHQGRRWPRVSLQAFMGLFVAGIVVFVVWWETHLWAMFRENDEPGAPLLVRNAFHIVMAIGGVGVGALFAGGAVLALRCLRSEDVRAHASRSGF